MLSIENLHVSVAGNEILAGIDLEVAAGEVHAIMGPNGSGKSTLAKAIAGNEDYEITDGRVLYDGRDLAERSIEERAVDGIFIGFQYPVEVPGVKNSEFLRLAYNARRRAHGEEELGEEEFGPILAEKMLAVRMDPAFADRALNAGFSGGQKKRNEILQMFVLEPRLAFLDETDSGLDIDALRIVAAGIEAYRSPGRAIVLVTHYQRLLDLVEPDRVHVLADGRIVRSGGPEIGHELEAKGYEGIAG